MLKSIGHHVGGRHLAGKGPRTQPVFNPATGEQTGVLSLANKADVDTAVEVAGECIRSLGRDHAAPACAHPEQVPAPPRGADVGTGVRDKRGTW
jgi:hypothetical protein